MYYNSITEDLEQSAIRDDYDDYLYKHLINVKNGYKWIKDNIPSVINDSDNVIMLDRIINTHDASKYTDEEYMPYANYFYGKKTNEVKESFDYAWLHHIHANPHHWQHWVLVNDDDGTKALDMPYEQIVAMICDHWAFSWNKGNLYEIFKWYDDHKKRIIFSDYTKKIYESILDKIKKELDKTNS